MTCTCKHDGQRWVRWCEPHKAEHDELHARAQREHEAEQKRRDLTEELI